MFIILIGGTVAAVESHAIVHDSVVLPSTKYEHAHAPREKRDLDCEYPGPVWTYRIDSLASRGHAEATGMYEIVAQPATAI